MREQYVGSHKYGSPFAAYLDERQEWADETFGDVNDYGHHYARFGRHVLETDTYGFVIHYVLTEHAWETLRLFYVAWCDEMMGDE